MKVEIIGTITGNCDHCGKLRPNLNVFSVPKCPSGKKLCDDCLEKYERSNGNSEGWTKRKK